MARNIPPFPQAHRNPPSNRRRSGARGRRGPREANRDPEVLLLLTRFLTHVRGNIRRLRHKAGLSQEHLAYATSVHPKTLQRLEAGTGRNPTLTTLAAVARGLGVDLWALCQPPAGEAPGGGSPPREREPHAPR